MNDKKIETWYRTSFGDTIDPVFVTRSTEKTVILVLAFRTGSVEKKAMRRTTYECYFPTWEEAKAYLVEEAEKRVVAAKRELEEEPERLVRNLAAREKKLARIKAMTESKGRAA